MNPTVPASQKGPVPKAAARFTTHRAPIDLIPNADDFIAPAELEPQHTDPVDISSFVERLVQEGKVSSVDSVKYFFLRGIKVTKIIREAKDR